ncbi:MAG: tetratricopeptide repeat protein [Candidatus Cloacimonetes bacterium]|nr:tetratricopeptide repeat protein [Candidatus Cloacimonadota bacterium]MCF7815312.1 tetratricopeptide repeat protein [Candidatus Cloacimonadota bacterium]MCF7869426.1 tetratricopeptide repeat protein [Candidatus Cloacimonadota bacterium]MCF7884815.1 tetratricopeptide repeat protein [Candidatus Cloacimonadota bacterium]
MKFRSLIALLILVVLSCSIWAADQDLNAQGKKSLRSANMHLKGGRYEKALPLYEEVLATNPHNVETLKKLGSIYFDVEKDYKKAYEYFMKAQNEIDELYAEYETMKQTDEKAANKFFKKQISKQDIDDYKDQLQPLLMSCWVKLFNEAKDYFDNEDYQTALDKYLYIYEIAPDSVQTTKMLAYTYSRLEMPDESLQFMIKSAELDSLDDYVRTNIGNIYFQKEQFEEAIKWYQDAADINPNIVDNYFNMALCYMRLQDDEKTMAAFEKVLEIEPDNLDALVNNSNIALKLEQHEKSLDYLKRAVEIAPDQEDFISNLTYRLAQDQKFDEVLIYAEKWKEINPESEEAQQLINLAKQKLKK